MSSKEEVKILAIESSCDETAAAVVVNGREVRSNVISSQIVSNQVLSALRSLTSVFGMRTGGSFSL